MGSDSELCYIYKEWVESDNELCVTYTRGV